MGPCREVSVATGEPPPPAQLPHSVYTGASQLHASVLSLSEAAQAACESACWAVGQLAL